MDAGLDLVELRTLVAVRETGSTTAAAAGLSGGPRAQVLIGVFGTAAALLPRALLRVREHCPGVGLRSVEVDGDDATSAVATGRGHRRHPDLDDVRLTGRRRGRSPGPRTVPT